MDIGSRFRRDSTANAVNDGTNVVMNPCFLFIDLLRRDFTTRLFDFPQQTRRTESPLMNSLDQCKFYP